MNKQKNVLIFLAGLFSVTQVHIIGYIGISELVMYVACPFLLLRGDYRLKRDGFYLALTLIFLWLCSAIFSDYYRETDWPVAMRGVAWPYALFAGVVCLHALLADDIRRLKWLLVGTFFSSLIALFILQPGSIMGMADSTGLSATAAAFSYKLTFLGIVSGICSLFIYLAYVRIPKTCWVLSLGLAGFALMEGGRSAMMCGLASSALLLVPKGNMLNTRKLGLKASFVLVIFVLTIFVSKAIYVTSVEKMWMGEAELVKYQTESQARIGLLSGRGHFLIAFYALCDSPLIGFGSWAIDDNGYGAKVAQQFLTGDGAAEKYQFGRNLIYLHSHLTQAWVWHGLMGGVFWIYILGLLFTTLTKTMYAIPELYAYLAMTIPSTLWNILFSPPGGRVGTAVIITVMLLLVHYRRQVLRHEVPDCTVQEMHRRATGPASFNSTGHRPGRWVI